MQPSVSSDEILEIVPDQLSEQFNGFDWFGSVLEVREVRLPDHVPRASLIVSLLRTASLPRQVVVAVAVASEAVWACGAAASVSAVGVGFAVVTWAVAAGWVWVWAAAAAAVAGWAWAWAAWVAAAGTSATTCTLTTTVPRAELRMAVPCRSTP